MILDECANYIEQTVSKYCIILRNGTILRSTIEENSIIKFLPVINNLLTEEIPPNHMFYYRNVVILRVNENLVLILLTVYPEKVISPMLEGFIDHFGEKLSKKYNKLPKTFGDLSKFCIVSVARQSGPEPLGWISSSSTKITEEDVFKYSLSSMMLLMNEINGAHQHILNFHPFISEGYLGLIYLFQIPLKNARGGAFDSAILVIIDYEERPIAYRNHKRLEKILAMTADEVITKFQQDFESNIQETIKNRENFEKILFDLQKRLDSIPLQIVSSEVLKDDMFGALKELSKHL